MKSGYWRRADGLYVAQVTVRRPDGSKGRKSLYGKTAAEVLAKKRKVMSEVDQGRSSRTRRAPTLATYFVAWREKKVADINSGYFSPTTLQQYEETWRRHIEPALGHYRLDELTAPVLRAWLDQKAIEVSAATGRPLSPDPPTLSRLSRVA